jgi:hypothetical protein
VIGLAVAVPTFFLLAKELGVGGSLTALAPLVAVIWVIKKFRAKA